MKDINDFIILDLFCGAGGMSYGMHQNPHFKTAVALDFDVKATRTFKHNFSSTLVITGDITDTAVKQTVIEASKKCGVNMIIGGPPCQGFSMKGKKLGLADQRNYLFKEYLYLVDILRPEVFVIENVKALLTTSNGWFRNEILTYISQLGYKVRYGVLNSCDYGVPQLRERAIFICSKTKSISLPKRSIEKDLTVQDAISDLAYLESGEGEFESEYLIEPRSKYQEMMRAGSLKLYNHKASNHSKIALEKLALIPPEGSKKSLPLDLRGKQKFNTTWGRLNWSKPSPTIDTRFDTPSNGTNSHPILNRSITPREAARIQSFDDRFVFLGNKVSIRAQIGNAVPPLMAKAIADAIWNSYENDRAFSLNSDKHEYSLDDEYKKEHGIFYTDVDLSKDMVNFLAIPETASCIDPWCGSGSFIYCLQNDCNITDLYGCDFDESTVIKCREITNCNNIRCLDTLGKPGNEVLKSIHHDLFDYLISNPPYAPLTKEVGINAPSDFIRKIKKSGGNLYIAALYRAFEYVKTNGIISLIIPKNFLHISSYKEIRQFILKEKNILSVIELGIHFKTVRGEQIILTIQNSHTNDNVVKFYDYNEGNIQYLTEVNQSFYDDEIIVFTSPSDVKLYNRFQSSKSYLKLEDLCEKPIHRGRSKDVEAVRGKQIRKMGFRDRELPIKGNQIFIQNIFSAEAGLLASYAGNLSATETVTVIDVKTDKTKYLLGLLNSRLCNYYLIRFLFNNSRLTIHTDGNYLNRIPIPYPTLIDEGLTDIVLAMESTQYMSEEWFKLNEDLNNYVYCLFSIPIQEIKHVESEMRKISASKWYAN